MNEQIDLFSYSMPRYHITKPCRLIELFAGIGSQYKALKNLGVDVESWKVVEWDKYAMASYNAVHGTDFKPSDICKIHAEDLELTERDKYCYIMTYSFPCQDISGAGKMAGLDKGSGTRSGLLWEVERILDECEGNLPDVLLMENVPMLLSKKHIGNFQKWRSKLESLGYSNYVQVLNAKNHGIPQNRARVFMVSILGHYFYSFPKSKPLKLKLKDMLEDQVDEKYYLSDKMVQGMISSSFAQRKPENKILERERVEHYAPGTTKSLIASKNEMNIDRLGNYHKSGHNASSIVSTEGLALAVMENHGTITAIKDKEVSNTIRGGGRGSTDRHEWDMIYEKDKSA